MDPDSNAQDNKGGANDNGFGDGDEALVSIAQDERNDVIPLK